MFVDTPTVAHRTTADTAGSTVPAPVRTARALTGLCLGVHVVGGGVAFGGTALAGAASDGMSHADRTLGPAFAGWSFGSLAIVTVVTGLLFVAQAFVDGWVYRMLTTLTRRRVARIVATAQPAVTRILTTVAIVVTTQDGTALVPGLTSAVVGVLVWSVLLWGPQSSRRWFAAPAAPTVAVPVAHPVARPVARPVPAPMMRRPVVTHRPAVRPHTENPTAVLALRIPAPRGPVGVRRPVRR